MDNGSIMRADDQAPKYKVGTYIKISKSNDNEINGIQLGNTIIYYPIWGLDTYIQIVDICKKIIECKIFCTAY